MKEHFGGSILKASQPKFCKTPPPQMKRKRSMGVRRVAGLTRNRLLMRFYSSTTGKSYFICQIMRIRSYKAHLFYIRSKGTLGGLFEGWVFIVLPFG
jgi:hypothetical protein